QPGLFVLNAPAGDKRDVGGGDGFPDHQIGRLDRHERIGGVAERAARRHEGEPVVGTGLPGEVGGYLDEVLVATAAIDEGEAQAVVERQVAHEHQTASTLIEGYQRDLEILLLVAGADVDEID